MKTVTKQNVSLYVFDDSESLTVTENGIIVGNPIEFIVGDCDAFYSEVTPPDGWKSGKYFYDGSAWLLNPDWVDLDIQKERAEQEALRQAAYASESDPIFFMAQRGEATMDEWTVKVAEIKARYPYPTEEV